MFVKLQGNGYRHTQQVELNQLKLPEGSLETIIKKLQYCTPFESYALL